MLCLGIGLKEYFNLSYTDIAKTDISTKLDQIGVPGYEAGGLENWGLIMYNPDLFDSNINDLSEEKLFEKIVLISHEIGHHWIGNLVTSKWWNDVWINEAGFLLFQINRTHPSDASIGRIHGMDKDQGA